jgi:3-polyprenyl-4-hydroxybenzoate decarboxylase
MGLGEPRYKLQSEISRSPKNPKFRNMKFFCPGVLVVEGPAWREKDGIADELLQEEAVLPFRLVCLVDDAANCVRSDSDFLWHVFTRFEPAADIYGRNPQLDRYHVKLDAPLVFDCRIKSWFPPIVEPDPETIKRVDRLWNKIFGGRS